MQTGKREKWNYTSPTHTMSNLSYRDWEMGREKGGEYLKNFCEGGAFGLSPNQLEKVDWEWIIEANS